MDEATWIPHDSNTLSGRSSAAVTSKRSQSGQNTVKSVIGSFTAVRFFVIVFCYNRAYKPYDLYGFKLSLENSCNDPLLHHNYSIPAVRNAGQALCVYILQHITKYKTFFNVLYTQ